MLKKKEKRKNDLNFQLSAHEPMKHEQNYYIRYLLQLLFQQR